ncbi:RHS repeat-associated core domain-containing protein [Trinickia caryophylli]|uniref:RHS repeat-associated core domain-containing protein n=1 Tax=Trinickia caryophylli TaxID=28094 RepID=A0A1X7FQ18_TRICW|nr:RHS repeat-associated core domain-containing protein [Trinickia caryophylli]WQE14286.1 RHS repeat-associated core domain-containing protein [Trinickia caryophylli]GLU33200.1 hypothetical protein Busp01_30420 [Trinickia caryophylli]SMF56495.1 RHS repeat-associated core domain-containing protein [Trinickia caryophylli]
MISESLWPAFTGMCQDPVSRGYPLGNGYRWYLPALRRFNAQDSLSPFGPAGIHPYVYCSNDPITRRDPTGHMDIDPEVWEVLGKLDRDLAEEDAPIAARNVKQNAGGVDEQRLIASSSRQDESSRAVVPAGNVASEHRLRLIREATVEYRAGLLKYQRAIESAVRQARLAMEVMTERISDLLYHFDDPLLGELPPTQDELVSDFSETREIINRIYGPIAAGQHALEPIEGLGLGELRWNGITQLKAQIEDAWTVLPPLKSQFETLVDTADAFLIRRARPIGQ